MSNLQLTGISYRAHNEVTYTYDWIQRTPGTSPSARYNAQMCYDVARQEVVLFGGYNNSSVLSDTWVWDGTDWAQKSPATSPPATREGYMAYDPVNQKSILFGGTAAVTFLASTWSWDGTTWTDEAPATTPTLRRVHSMAYDETNAKIVLHGGFTSGFVTLTDTWTWDNTDWTNAAPANNPASDLKYRISSNPLNGDVIYYGGSAGGRYTWSWNGTNWTDVTPSVQPDSGFEYREKFGMVGDTLNNRVIIFGGEGAVSVKDDTWGRTSGDWLDLAPATNPSARARLMMAYDSVRSEVVMFGGATLAQITLNNETWIYSKSG